MDHPIEILITVPLSEQHLSQIKNESPGISIQHSVVRKAGDIPDEVWKKTEVLYTSRVVPEPEQAPNLRWIQFNLAGIDHAIQASIPRKAGVIVTTLSGAASTQVAEHVLMMLLSLGHHLPEMISSQRRAEWPKDRWERFLPIELRENTVGIVGYGSIGRQVARLLADFGAQVLATKRDVLHPEDDGFTPERFGDPRAEFVHRIYPPQALGSMIKVCDFVVVTVPLTPATKGMLNADTLGLMKPTAFLVDVSRGGIVDHNALITALKDHRIAGAALDVFPEEPLPESSPLWKLPNVILTPHISGNTSKYEARAVVLFIENLQRYLAGQPLYNQVEPDLGY